MLGEWAKNSAQSQDGGALVWNTLSPIQNGPGPNQNHKSGPVPDASLLPNASWSCLSRAHMQGNIQCTYFLIHPWSKNLLWILLEWVEGTCTVMLLHSNLETWVLSSEQLALLNAGQCVRGVCIRIQERIAVSARNWCSGTHWFQTTNGPPVLTLWFSISVKVMVWSGLWAPCLELLNAAFPFRFERDVTEQDLQFSEVQSWARQS